MTPATRKALVQQWRRFSRAFEAQEQQRDDAVDVVTVGDVLNATVDINRLNAARATYLRGLVEAGVLGYRDNVPDDDHLWEIHPANFDTPEGVADLWED